VTSNVTVTVRNFGNQNVTTAFDVTLQDTSANVTIGTQTVAGLAAGGAATLTFAWAPATTGDHTLLASHSLSDDRPGNDRRNTTIPMDPPLTDVAVTSFS